MRQHKQTAEETPFSILTVDDDPIMTSTIQAYFQRSGYQVDVENDPRQAVERVRAGHYDILLLDFLMTPICGDQVVEQVRTFNQDIFIILLTGHKSMAPPIKTIRALDIQGYYEKSDRFDQLELLVESCAKSIRQMRTVREYRDKLDLAYRRLQDGYIEVVDTLRRIVDAKDTYTKGHSDRVSYYAAALARHMGRDEAYCEQVRMAGLFHDVGKLSIPDRILLKDGKLTDEEYAVIQTHPRNGVEILSALSQFRPILPGVLSHHERYGGGGYPEGLRGTDIPEMARIIAVADSFDAMTSDRQYRKSLGFRYAMEELERGCGTQFDPEIARAFLAMAGDRAFWDRAERDMDPSSLHRFFSEAR